YFLTETQKDMARIHEIDPALLDGMWNQFDAKGVARKGLTVDLSGNFPSVVKAPEPPPFSQRSRRADYGKEDLNNGFSLDLWVELNSLKADQWLVDIRTADGRGYALRTTGDRGVEIILSDGRTESRWASDPGALVAGRPQHIVAIVDGGPEVITFVIDGKLNDGGDARQFGWGRFNPNMKTAAGAPEMRIGQNLDGKVLSLRLYSRYLRTSEAIAAFRAGL
ncbi:MAG: LamG-like jellyroll fold domain-containing protein, partial [Bryobacteraceae bacterium]